MEPWRHCWSGLSRRAAWPIRGTHAGIHQPRPTETHRRAADAPRRWFDTTMAPAVAVQPMALMRFRRRRGEMLRLRAAGHNQRESDRIEYARSVGPAVPGSTSMAC